MALFGAPASHEDDPERAVRAALAIRDWLAEQNGPQQARIAVATGEAHVTLGAHRNRRRAGRRWGRRQHGCAPAGRRLGQRRARRRADISCHEARDRIPRDRAAWRQRERARRSGYGRRLARWHSPASTLPGTTRRFVGRERELAALQERLDLGRLGTLAPARYDFGRPRHRQDAPRLRVATMQPPRPINLRGGVRAARSPTATASACGRSERS